MNESGKNLQEGKRKLFHSIQLRIKIVATKTNTLEHLKRAFQITPKSRTNFADL